MRIYRITIALLFLSSFSAQAQKCDCSKDVIRMVEVYENDYSGYADLKTSSPEYKRLVQQLLKKATVSADLQKCEALLKTYIDYIDNGHVYLKQTEANPGYGSPKIESGMEPSFSVLSDKTVYIRIPSAHLKFKRRVDSLIRVNEAVLAGRPNLIIDVRGNRGGGDGTFAAIKPYLYTTPVVRHLPEFYASPGNTDMYRDLSNNSLVDSGTRSFLKGLVVKMEKAPGSFVPMFGNATDTLKYEAVLKFPARVGILIDGKCGSATEEFLLFAKQSRKVKLFGKENSSGTLDYSNLRDVILPSAMWVVTVPTSRSSRLPETPFDKTGVAPDVLIKADARVVSQVMKYLEKVTTEK